MTTEERLMMINIVEECVGNVSGSDLRKAIDKELIEIIGALEVRGYTPRKAEALATEYLEAL